MTETPTPPGQPTPTDVLSAYMSLTEAAGVTTDVSTLAGQAGELLRAALPDLASAYYEWQDGQWWPRMTSGEVPGDLAALLQAGGPLGTPAFVRAAEAKAPLFTEYWNAPAQDTAQNRPEAGSYQAVALAPYFEDGQPCAMFVAGTTATPLWSPSRREMFTAVWRSLGGALDRAGQIRRRERQAALDAFVSLTEAIGTETDLEGLAQWAMRLIREFRPELSVVYYSLDDGRWTARSISDDVHPELADSLRSGLRQSTPAFQAAVRERAPVFIDGWDAQEQQVDRTEGYGAAAVYPYFRDGQPWGMLAIGTQRAHAWTRVDRAVFTAVGRSLGLALDWAGQAETLQAQNEVLDAQTQSQDAFVAYTEAVGNETDVRTLARQALDLLRLRFEGSSTGYYELEDDLWKLKVYTEDMEQNPEGLAQFKAGLPRDTPLLREARRGRGATFVDGWDGRREGVEHAEMYTTVAIYPLTQGGEPRALLATSLRDQPRWQARDQAIFRAVGRGLDLALERATTADALQRQNAELEARTSALEAFAALSTDLSVQSDPYALVRRAQEVALSLLSPGYALYYERDGERWHNRVQVGGVGHPDLQAFIDAGPLVGQTPSVDRPWTSQQPLFQDVYAQGSDTPAEIVQHVNAAASLPVLRRGETIGVFITVLFDQRAWTRTDRAVLETVVRSLELALDRTEQSRQREEETHAQEAFVRFTELAGNINDLGTLIQEAFGILTTLFPGSSAVMYERRDGRWMARQLTPDISPELGAMLQAGLPSETPIFAEAARTHAPVFVDEWSAAREQVAETDLFSAAAVYPFEQNGELIAALSVALGHQTHWTERDRALIRAVGRSFSLLYERIAAAEALTARQQGAERRSQVLEAFAQLTADLQVRLDPVALMRRAQEVALSLLPNGYAAYYELQDGQWALRSQVGGRSSPELERFLTGPFPAATTPFLTTPWQTGIAEYHAAAPWEQVQRTELVSHILASMAAPVRVGDVQAGIFAIGLYDQRGWTFEDEAMLETVLRSLGLALERARSVTQLAERSAQLERSNIELQAANEELEAFTYSASHDLRTPVRHVMGFSELARKALTEGAPDKATQHMRVVEQAAVRMSSLIDAMLQLSRTTSRELEPSRVELAALVERARQDVEPDLAGRQVDWAVAPLPTVLGDATMLQQVMTNLLANAVKFTSGETRALIEVWADDRSDEWVINVRDNGVGFDPVYTEKLFGVFQRLHNQREFEGTGVGLATVRRIIARHGGRVSASSVLTEGATFSFTLPKALA